MSAPAPIAFATSPEEVIPPSAMTGTPWSDGRLRDVPHRRHLRDAHAGDDARRADRARALADLEPVRARVQQRLSGLGGRDVPRYHLDVVRVLDRAHHVEDALRVAVRRVDDEHIDLGVDERRRAFQRVVPDPDRCGDTQPTPLVLRRERVRIALRDVLHGDQALEPPLEIDDRELLDPVAAENRLGLLEGRPDRRRHEPLARHRLGDTHRGRDPEAKVAVRQDPDEAVLGVRDRDARDPVALHQLERVADERLGRERHGLHDHPGLRALDLVDLRDLIRDREVPMEDADPAEAGEADGHARLRDGVHRGGDERDLERDRAGQAARGRDVVREDGGLGGEEQDVVEGEALLRELVLQVTQVTRS